MHPPTVAVFSQVWRYRWTLLASTVYLVAVVILRFVGPETAVAGGFQCAMVLPVVVGLIPLFAYLVDADVAGRDSTFPARMFVLPLTTRALVGWPILYGTVAIALAWLAAASFLIRPAGWDVPLWWPAFLLAGCLAWFQAIVWCPFGLPWLRMVVVVLPVGAMVGLSGLRWMVHLPELVVSPLLGSMIPLAYLVAVRGVSRARCGDPPDWHWPATLGRDVAGWLSRPARSWSTPLRAQVWLEWRRHGLGCPIFAGLTILLLSAWVVINRHNSDLSPNHPLRSPLLLLEAPLVALVATGSLWGKYEDSRGGPSMPAFLATRPMTCGGLIWAKMKAAAFSAAIVWGMTLAAFALLVLLTGSWTELTGQLNVLAKGLTAVQKVVAVTLGIVLLLAITWKLMIVNLCLGLTGRTWTWNVVIVVLGAATLAVVSLGRWIYEHPRYHADLLAAVPWALGSAAALKLLLGGWLVRVLLRRRLVQPQWLARVLAVWLLTAAGLTGLLCWLLPAGIAPWYLITAGVTLAMPLVRISLAPLALAWNRHR